MNATLSTHVLDTARGVPAAGVVVTLVRVVGVRRDRIGSAMTNADGRTSEPLGSHLEPGVYELVFDVTSYFADAASFYDEISVRVVLDGSRERYHVPLLLSPYGYSTYRGS